MSLPNLSPSSLAPVRAVLPSLGAHPSGDGVRFSLFTTRAASCAVRLFDETGRATATLPLVPEGDGIFAVTVPGIGAGTLYKFVLEDNELPDPYARWLPLGVHGPAAVPAPHGFAFRHENVTRPLREQVIYELHVGTFTAEGTYQSASRRLPYLAELGVTTIELMPLAAFDGTRGWGYDGVALFAPFAPYGTPAALCAFIDEAHGLGIAVILDVVYNHFGPAGNYLSAYCPDYFTKNAANAWGDAPNFQHPALRGLVINSALHWLGTYRFDGLRLDATHAIADPSPCHILQELAREVRQTHPGAILVAEDERNDPAVIDVHGLDAVWADDFHHVVRVALTRESDGYYAAYPPGAASIAETIEAGWLYRGQVSRATGKARGKDARHLDVAAFVYCIQNHDQIGNRAHGDRLTNVVSIDAYCAASTLLLFLPMTPLLFMGQEWASSTPFQYFTDHAPELGRLISEGRRREFQSFLAVAHGAALPDPQDPATFQRSKLIWEDLLDDRHQRVHFLYRRLLQLRREDPVLSRGDRNGLSAHAEGSVVVVTRRSEGGERVLAVNFSEAPAPIPSALRARTTRPPILATCDWTPGTTELPPFGAVILS